MKSCSNFNMHLEQKEINRGYPRNCLFELTLFRQYNPFSIWKDVTKCCFKCVNRLLNIRPCGGIMGRSFMRWKNKGKLFESRFFIYFSECILGKHCISKQVWVAKFVLHWMQLCWKWHLPFSTHKCFLLFFRLQKLKGNVSHRECV